MKICSRCKKEFEPPSEYKEVYCKECRNIAQKEYYKRLKEKNKSDLTRAREKFGLNDLLTRELITKRLKELMMEAHPDKGGTQEEASEINKYYKVLLEHIIRKEEALKFNQ